MKPLIVCLVWVKKLTNISWFLALLALSSQNVNIHLQKSSIYLKLHPGSQELALMIFQGNGSILTPALNASKSRDAAAEARVISHLGCTQGPEDKTMFLCTWLSHLTNNIHTGKGLNQGHKNDHVDPSEQHQ